MDMGIVNAGQLTVYEDIPTRMREALKTCCSTASRWTERLLELAQRYKNDSANAPEEVTLAWRGATGRRADEVCAVHGIADFVVADTEEARLAAARPLDVIEGPLMSA